MKVVRIGNSLYLPLRKERRVQLGWEAGDEVVDDVVGDQIVYRRIRRRSEAL
ncbi:MAG: hypothetical protein ACXQS1_04865 [Methermicoccaceae archaeon]